MSVIYSTHNEFVERWKAGDLTVSVNKWRAGDFVLSKYADKHNKPAYLFWSWTGIIFAIPLPIALFFLTSWIHSIGSFILGLIVIRATRESACEFILQNILEDEDFWNYVLLHGGVKIKDKNNNEIYSAWLKEMGEKYDPLIAFRSEFLKKSKNN